MSAFTDLYPNLPGMLVDFKDGGLALRTDVNPPNTDSMLIIGTAVDGPFMEPVAVDAGTLELIFGKDVKPNGVPNGATIGSAFKQAYDDGCRDIRVMKVTGETSKLSVKTASRSVTSEVKVEQNLLAVLGNDVTTLATANIPTVGSVRVSAKGILLTSGLTITEATKSVVIAANTCDAGANISITYMFEGNSVTEIETVGHVAFVTLGVAQASTLTQAPVVGTLHLYVNDAEVLTAGAFTNTGTAFTLDKKKFPMGSTVAVSYMYSQTANVVESIELESYFASDIYDQGYVEVLDILDTLDAVIGKEVIIHKPLVKRSQVTDTGMSYKSTSYPTLTAMVNAINTDVNNGVYRARTTSPMAETTTLVKTAEVYFTGGDHGITTDKNVLYKALSGERDAQGYLTTQGAYQLLEDYQVDWVNVVGVYADDILAGRYQNFAYELALFCAISSYRNNTTLGAIAMKPVNDIGLADLQAYTAHLIAYKNIYLMRDANGNLFKDSTTGLPIDLGKFLSVVGGPESEYFDTDLGSFYGNPAVTYTALNSTLLPQSAPTNKRVQGAKKARYRLSNTQLDAITGNRIVTFKTKIEKFGGAFAGVYCVDGVTSALTGSDYTRVTTPKSLKTLINNIREVADPFLGESTSVEQRNALAAAISKRIGLLIDKSVVQDAEFQLISSLQDQVLGQASIELSAVPPQEFRKITVVVGLKASL